jgi:uncharacterized protein YdeI (YjbR/CyaY-like superfamily)
MKTLNLRTRKQWRDWLRRNHDREDKGIWLVFHKGKKGGGSLDYEVAVEEALCFGWIDSIIRRIDEERYVRKFTPRRSGSRWSESNKRRAQKVTKEGRMTEHGLAKIEAAKASGLWDKTERPRISLEMPEELQKALRKSRKARKLFEQLAPTYQRQFIIWVKIAKRKATRDKRVEESIALLEQGKKLGLR